MLEQIDSEGYMTNSSLASFAKEQLPPEYHPLYWRVMGGCHQEWGKFGWVSLCVSYGHRTNALKNLRKTNCGFQKKKLIQRTRNV